MSFKLSWIYFVICSLTVALLFAGANSTRSKNKNNTGRRGNCTCAGFDFEKDGNIVLSQTPDFPVKCDGTGALICKNVCVALAIMTKAKGPAVLCEKIKNATELRVCVFFKTCKQQWTYSGVKSDRPLCCNDGVVKKCESEDYEADIANATITTMEALDLVVDAKQ